MVLVDEEEEEAVDVESGALHCEVQPVFVEVSWTPTVF
jgi:hypothetical protein